MPLITKDNKDWARVPSKLDFEKKLLEFGTIVMFKNKKFGIYIDGPIAKDIKRACQFGLKKKEYFLSYNDFNDTAGYSLDDYSEDLVEKSLPSWDVVRIYINKFTKKELELLAQGGYFRVLNPNFLKEFIESKINDDKEYVERKRTRKRNK